MATPFLPARPNLEAQEVALECARVLRAQVECSAQEAVGLPEEEAARAHVQQPDRLRLPYLTRGSELPLNPLRGFGGERFARGPIVRARRALACPTCGAAAVEVLMGGGRAPLDAQPRPPPPTHVNRSLAVALERLAISRRALPCAARARCSWRARADRLTKRRVVDLHRLEHVGAPPVACVSEGERVDHHETATGELLTRGGVGGDQPSELRAAGLRPGGRVRLLGRVLNQRVHEARGHSVVLERLIGCGTGSGTTGQRACQLVLQVPTQRRWYVKCSSGLCEE